MTPPASKPTRSESDHLPGPRTPADPTVFRLADLADAILDTAAEPVRLRLVLEFLRGAAEDGHPVQSLVAAEPAPTGVERLDALLAAIAEDQCVHADIRPPAWVFDESRFLDGIGGSATCPRPGPRRWYTPQRPTDAAA